MLHQKCSKPYGLQDFTDECSSVVNVESRSHDEFSLEHSDVHLFHDALIFECLKKKIKKVVFTVFAFLDLIPFPCNQISSFRLKCLVFSNSD